MKIKIIGAGLGGLAAACRLQSAGHLVEIYEKEALPGGRAHLIVQDGYRFDTGPTILMMLAPLRDLFTSCGKTLEDYLELRQLEPNYRVVFPDHSHITMASNVARLQAELARIDEKAPEQFYRFFGDVAEIYRLAEKQFIDKNFDKLSDFVSPTAAISLLRKRGLKKLINFVSSYFDDPRLVQLFSFQSMYLGVSPYEAPAVYSVVSYMETGLGIWYPKGGMHQLPTALAKMFTDLGGKIHYSAPIDKIIVENGQTTGLRLANGKKVTADAVVANADLPYVYRELLEHHERPHMPDPKLNKLKQASSAFLFYWGVEHELPDLLHHNVYFSKDFKRNLEQIFNDKVLPDDPAFYIYVPTKTDPDLAPKNRHVVYILVPVPNLNSQVKDWAAAQKKIKERVLDVLKSHFNADIGGKIETEAVFEPQDFKDRFNLTDGTAFGLSHYFFQSGYFRPHNYVKGVRGLYLCGASTYPGSGIPMVILSGKLAAERLQKDFAK